MAQRKQIQGVKRDSTREALRELRDALRHFAAERDWDQFHSPKNLSIALSVEAAELLERFQWMKEDESKHITPDTLQAVAEEMADILLYLVRLADKLDVDLIKAAKNKMEVNRQKYPIAKARGSSRKYSDL